MDVLTLKQLEDQFARQKAMLEDMKAHGRAPAKIKAMEDLVKLTARRIERAQAAENNQSPAKGEKGGMNHE